MTALAEKGCFGRSRVGQQFRTG